jgi:hypothetical protein
MADKKLQSIRMRLPPNGAWRSKATDRAKPRPAANPRRMSDILGQMSSEADERLTVELANRATASAERNIDAGNLPKIEGVPKN